MKIKNPKCGKCGVKTQTIERITYNSKMENNSREIILQCPDCKHEQVKSTVNLLIETTK